MKPQTELILDHLLDGKKITGIEALRLYSCRRLASRISEIAKEIIVHRRKKTFKNRFGRKVSVTEYWI